jgi:hypothetical protein
VVELLLPELARHYPQHFQLTIDGRDWCWQNRLRRQTTRFRLGDEASLPTGDEIAAWPVGSASQPPAAPVTGATNDEWPADGTAGTAADGWIVRPTGVAAGRPLAPLDWMGRQVQEDLLLMGATEAAPLVAGQLCFPSGWCLDDKLGHSFLAIHAPVPGFAQAIGQPALKLMQRLKRDRPVWRVNWAIKPTDRLDLPPASRPSQRALRRLVTATNAGQRCFLRVERQTLSRLPRSGLILFTIHTFLTPLAELCAEPLLARRLLGILRSAPADFLAHKGITDFAAPLLAYLAAQVEGEAAGGG